MVYKAGLLGLGKVAYKFGQDIPSSSSLSHFSAIKGNPKVNLEIGYSPNKEEAKKFQKETGIETTSDINFFFKKKLDLVSVCSPSKNHFDDFLSCYENSIPMIWLEKPIAIDKKQLLYLKKNFLKKKSKTKTLINFYRRYHSSYIELKNLIKRKNLGKLEMISVNYSKGLLENGIHMLDLVLFLLDESQLEIVWHDSVKNNPNPIFILTNRENKRIIFCGMNLNFHNIDIQITFSDGRASILHGGMSAIIEKKVENNLFKGFYRLDFSNDNLVGKPGFNMAFDRALEDLITSFEKSRQPISNLETSIQSHLIIEKLNLLNR
ncbi:Gfo/Idh/MocA family oxidoreductase [SAR86 cluster bacterium]|nr:Gfo/Idh/MocA family oxidoreductase [SAR86 cluster bacterium]